MNPLSSLLNHDLSRFKLYHEQTLFPIDKETIIRAKQEKRCIYCGLKIKFPRTGKIAYCNSPKHPKRFVIKLETLNANN